VCGRNRSLAPSREWQAALEFGDGAAEVAGGFEPLGDHGFDARERRRRRPRVRADRGRAGRGGPSISQFDATIAAIARSRGADGVATRNTADFARCGVEIINPWKA
jgi:hypothetical protein